MNNKSVTLGEQLIQLLERYNTELVFGIPGVHTIELYRGLDTSTIKHITPRHEQGAGFMADGYARATGKVGVCLCITGPGMTNIATAMGQAYADSIPMLVISSVNKTNTLGLGRGHLHELKNQQALISGVSEFSHTLLKADDLPNVLARAFTVFKSARPRPVHIEIPIDLMSTPVADQSEAQAFVAPEKPAPKPGLITQATNYICDAKRAVVLVGGGCINAQASLKQFVERLGAPTCLTINAKGLLPPNHPLLLDGVQTVKAFRDYVASCDLCIAIGTELGETDYDFYDEGPLVTNGNFIRIDIDPKQINTNAEVTLGIVSDAELAFTALCSSIQKRPDFFPQANAKEIVLEINNAMRIEFVKATEQYETLLQNISTVYPNAIVVGDSTKPIYHLNFTHRASAPRRWFNAATGFGTLGYALPAAIGAKLGKPNSPVIAIAGDGGFQFTLNELITAVQAGVAIVIIIWNNNSYKEISDYMERNSINRVGVDVQGPNLELLAQAMHTSYAKAEQLNDIQSLLQDSSDCKTPMLIEYVANIDA